MRKVLIFLVMFLLPLIGTAQEKISLKPYIEYGYSNIYQHNVNLAAIVDYKIAPSCALRGGYQINTANFQAAVFETKLIYKMFYLENKYLYRAFNRNNSQDLAIGLVLGCDLKHFDIKLGYNIRFYTQLKSDFRTYITEPANLLCSVEYRVFEKDHKWNIGAKLSNMDDFNMERYGAPFIGLLANYRINDGINLFANYLAKTSGFHNIAIAYWSNSIKLGVELVW